MAALWNLARDRKVAVFHYVPLHSSPAGRKSGRAAGDLPVTDNVAARLLRLPIWAGMSDRDIEYVTGQVARALVEARSKIHVQS
jgi:dTDP-4-amino-4,6-dideoxygalactose transaminase